jgi:hypothetical protein
MDKHPRVLVVTPTLGESRFLEDTVLGVASLGASILHVISAPAGRVGSLQSRFPWTRVVADAGRAGGIYGALNAALGSVTDGWEWFTYINDDDLLLPGFATLVSRHEKSDNPEPVALIRDNGKVMSRVTTERSPGWIPALLKQGISPLMQQGMLFHRKTVARLGGFDTRYRLCADLDFWLRSFAFGDRFRHYPINVARFRIRSGQLSSDTALTIREQNEIVARHLPREIHAGVRICARWRYRVCNLPRYLERYSTSGIRTSYEILASGGSRSS